MTKVMRTAELYGPRDLRIREVPIPDPAEGELLIKIEACGVCPTDVRKFRIGVHDGGYPLNPGHEWVGRVVAQGPGTDGWQIGTKVYGDTYAGYAEYAIIPTNRGRTSYGAVRLPEELPAERAVFLEPTADCFHAWIDGARLRAGDRALVFGAGQMGLQLVGVATDLGAEVIAVEPRSDRHALALEFGAVAVATPEDLPDVLRAHWREDLPDVIVASIGSREVVAQAIRCAGTGGRIVLFAGFGDDSIMEIDLNEIHYRELSLVGTTWIGMPPHQQWERYDQALDSLQRGAMAAERLISATCTLDELEEQFERQANHLELKTLLIPGESQ